MSEPKFTTDEPIDIGPGVTVEIHRVDGEAYGLTEHHTDPSRPTHDAARGNCCGYCRFDNDVGTRVHADYSGPRWKVESLDPLTLSPSILCSCGHHGFIKQGKWIPA